jgi:phosphatidylserine/phosphatidylglycerophosphate/cardiolipin synthase-like enzyme
MDKNGLVEMAGPARLRARQVCNERHIEMRLLADWFPSIAGALEKNHARLRQSGSVNLLFLIPFVKTFWN